MVMKTKFQRIPTSGAAGSVLNREYTFSSYDMNDCSMTYNTADGTLFVASGSTSYQLALVFKFDSGFNVYSTYMQINDANSMTWTNFAKDSNGNAYLFFRSDYSYNFGLIVRFNMATFSYNGTCSSSYTT